MCGHSVLRNLEKPRYFACGDPVRFATHQEAKRLQPGGLSERGEAGDGLNGFHISSFIEVYYSVKTGGELRKQWRRSARLMAVTTCHHGASDDHSSAAPTVFCGVFRRSSHPVLLPLIFQEACLGI